MKRHVQYMARIALLHVPDYWDFMLESERHRAMNGTGPDIFPAWLRAVLDVRYKIFLLAVFVHDVEWDQAKTARQIWESNRRFLLNCLILSLKAGGWFHPVYTVLLIKDSFKLYAAVQVGATAKTRRMPQ